MPFEKGKSGNPGGRVKDKPWVEAIRIAASAEDAEGKRKLRRIAEKTVAMALEGDIQAIKEIGDRLDGKPAQEQTLTVRNELDQLDDAGIRELIRRELAEGGDSGPGATQPEHPVIAH